MGEYQALYRAWRPEYFKDVYGQEAVTRTLKRQIVSGHIGHAYLFCGSRGTGKTTTAKIMARAVNCLGTIDGEPCGECEVCRKLRQESSLDVLEIDAASNNGVDEVRLLRDRIAYPPTLGKYKVYIIDEVHMLSISAFNALLKTLEEPPAHAVFILATTEPQKLPATVLSRCQRYDFKRISIKDITARLSVVLEGIGRSCKPDALEEIASAADGGMRDALSLLDMCLSYTDECLEADLVRRVLGSSGREFMFDFTDAIQKGDTAKALSMIDEAMKDGRDPAVFASETAAHLRTVLMGQMMGESLAQTAQLTDETAVRFLEQGKAFEHNRLLRAMDLFIHAEDDMRYITMPRSVIEMCAVRAARVSREKSVEGLQERIEALEKQLENGVKIQAVPAEKKAEEKKADTAAPAREKAPAQTPEPADPNDPNRALYEKAINDYLAKAPQVRGFMGSVKYIKTEEDVVQVMVTNAFHKLTLEKKSSEMEACLTAAFGRNMRINFTTGTSGSKTGQVSGRDLSHTFDVFGRENVEVVD